MRLILLIVFIIPIKAFGFEYQIDTIDFHSTILNETRRLYFYKPLNLNHADSVIFIYLLDGEYSANRYKEIQNDFPDKHIIAIGILNTDRRRDMLPLEQPGKFLEFIKSELIPGVENNYLVKKRVLFGHSFGGGFVINSMIRSPGLFDKYIASSPTPIMPFIDSDIYKQLDKELLSDIQFYFSYGSEDMKQVRKWAKRLNDSLTCLEFDNIDWKCDIYEARNHSNSDLLSIKNGLPFAELSQ